MGQKVHPIGYRLGVTTEAQSRWYADKKSYAKKLHEDLKLRKYIRKRWEGAGISRIDIERVGPVVRFTIATARPGVVIGKGDKATYAPFEIDDVAAQGVQTFHVTKTLNPFIRADVDAMKHGFSKNDIHIEVTEIIFADGSSLKPLETLPD